jgi:hypothetical protein
MYLNINDYEKGKCFVYKVSVVWVKRWDDERWEFHITENLGFRLSTIDWFVCSGIEFK